MNSYSPPWVHVFTKGSAAIIVLAHKHKLKAVQINRLPTMVHTWSVVAMTDGVPEIVGALYYRKIRSIEGIQSIDETE